MEKRDISLALAVAALVLTGNSSAAERAALTLVVQVSNQTGTEESILALAKVQADLIFKNVGVRVAWMDASAGPYDPGCDGSLLVTLLPTGTVWHRSSQGLKESVLGSATRAIRRAFVYPGRVSELAGRTRSDFSQVLGRVIVHEIGHLVLPAGHSQSGIMSAHMETEPARESALFTVSEARTIRARLESKAADPEARTTCRTEAAARQR